MKTRSSRAGAPLWRVFGSPRTYNPTRAFVAVVLCTALAACAEAGPPTAPTDAKADSATLDGANADGSLSDGSLINGGDGGRGSEPVSKPIVVLSAATAPTAAERAQWKTDFKAQKAFDATRLRPDAVQLAQSACDAAVIAKDSLRFPAAGNAALLQLKAGTVLVGDRADPSARRAAKGNNV